MTDASENDDNTQTIEAFLKQADIARQRQAWDDVVKIYQVALRQVPTARQLRRGLAAAYVAKADRLGVKPFYHRALEEYWRLVNSDPADSTAHEGLFTAAVKADQLAEVMEEYRGRIASQPDVEHYRTAFKKIQALYLLKAEPTKAASSGGGFLHVALARVAPIVALVCLLGWVVVRAKIGPQPEEASPKLFAVAVLLRRTGIFMFIGSLVYQIIRYLRTSK